MVNRKENVKNWLENQYYAGYARREEVLDGKSDKRLVNYLGYTSLARASLGIYTIKEDIDEFIKALYKAKDFFS